MKFHDSIELLEELHKTQQQLTQKQNDIDELVEFLKKMWSGENIKNEEFNLLIQKHTKK